MRNFLRNNHWNMNWRRVIFTGVLLAIAIDRNFTPVLSDAETTAVAHRYILLHPARLLPDFVFQSDGCSLWPDGWWVKCCIEHDEIYWGGGTINEKRAADSALLQCVNTFVPGMGNFMWLGVRVGGGPNLPTPWRFGYGWEWPHEYDK